MVIIIFVNIPYLNGKIFTSYNDVCNYGTLDYLPYNNYPFQVNTGDVFRIEYLMNDGSGFIEYLRSDGEILDNQPITRGFLTE